MPTSMQSATSTTDTQTAFPSSASHTATTAQSGQQDSTSGGGAQTQTAPQTQPQSKEEADRLYEERMEDEYAKREGGELPSDMAVFGGEEATEGMVEEEVD